MGDVGLSLKYISYNGSKVGYVYSWDYYSWDYYSITNCRNSKAFELTYAAAQSGPAS